MGQAVVVQGVREAGEILLIDTDRQLVLFYTDISVFDRSPALRAALTPLLAAHWPGWRLAYAHRGLATLLEHAGLPADGLLHPATADPYTAADLADLLGVAGWVLGIPVSVEENSDEPLSGSLAHAETVLTVRSPDGGVRDLRGAWVPDRLLATVDDLLWTLTPKSATDVQAMIAMLPRVVRDLQRGAANTMEAAARLGDRISHLVLVGTAFPMKVSPALIEASQADPEKALRMVNVFSRSTLAAPPSALGPGTWVFGAGMALGRKVLRSNPQVNVFHRGFVACDSYAGGEAAMAALTCPVLFALGSQDQMTAPKGAQGLVNAARAAGQHVEVATLPVGHNQMTEAPEEKLHADRADAFEGA